MLNNNTISKLAKALTPEVIDYITESDEFVQFLHTLVPEAIDKKLGKLDEDLSFELGLSVIENILVVAAE